MVAVMPSLFTNREQKKAGSWHTYYLLLHMLALFTISKFRLLGTKCQVFTACKHKFLANRMRNRVMECCMYIMFYCIPTDGAHDTSLSQLSCNTIRTTHKRCDKHAGSHSTFCSCPFCPQSEPPPSAVQSVVREKPDPA